MKRTVLYLIVSAICTICMADNYTILFNSSQSGSDATSATTDVAKLVSFSNYDFVSSIDPDGSRNIYQAKNGYGIKGGKSTAGGRIVMRFDTIYTVRSLTLWAASANKSDTAKTKGISVCGETILWNSPRLELQPYKINLNKPTDSIDISSLVEKNNRFYIEKIELDIEDTYISRGKIQMPALKHKFESMEYDPEQPAEDVESFELLAQGITSEGISLEMKTGTTYSVYPDRLPATGGEFQISYISDAQPSYFDITDSCIVTAKGLNGTMIRRAMAVSVMITEYHPVAVDSTGMVISVSPKEDYYTPIEGLKDSVLKSGLSRIINCGVRYRYGSGKNHTWAAFYNTDRDYTNNQVLDMYSDNMRYFSSEKPTASVPEFDIEHMFPKSWWGGTVNAAYQDLYHLVPGDYSANRSKSNCAPGIPADTTFWNGSFATGTNEHGRVFCPSDNFKGDFARAYFYIACCYGDSLTWSTSGSAAEAMDNKSWQEFQPWLRDLLLSWHRMDPVSEKEINRAVEVNRIQGNRNPFIDYPDLVEYIWGDNIGKALELNSLSCSFTQTATSMSDTGILLPERNKKVYNGHIVIYDGLKYYTITGQELR